MADMANIGNNSGGVPLDNGLAAPFWVKLQVSTVHSDFFFLFQLP
jgi:hypothetical protein